MATSENGTQKSEEYAHEKNDALFNTSTSVHDFNTICHNSFAVNAHSTNKQLDFVDFMYNDSFWHRGHLNIVIQID